MTKEQILNASSYTDIFTQNGKPLKTQYSNLILKFHPDRFKDPDATKVSMKLNLLYAEAKKHLADNTWGIEGNTLLIRVSDDTSKKIVYRYSSPNETGMVYIANSIVVYEFDDKKYYDRYLDNVENIKYKDEKMKEYFSRFLPVIHDKFKSYDDKYYIVLRKTEDVFPLSLVKDIFTKKEHSAWIMTRLLNLCTLFYVNNYVHNGITIDDCFVSLEHHGLSLLGGWQFSCPVGVKLIGMSTDVFNILPQDIKTNKIASFFIDIISSKEIVKNLLGASTFLNLEKICGKDMAEFLMSTKRNIKSNSTNIFSYFDDSDEDIKDLTTLDELREWEKVRSKTFPKHEFIKIEGITADDVFKK